jgi:hypothetical protein
MAETYKILAQKEVTPAGSYVSVYTVPGSKAAVVSSITICNRGINDITFRMRMRASGDGDDNKQFVYYYQKVRAEETFQCTAGWTMATGDNITINVTAATVTVNVFGTEIDV